MVEQALNKQQTLSKRTFIQSGFTIVELLIVIVIIGILAALVIVAYTGIQNRAYDTTVQTDLRNIGQKFEVYNSENGVYPTAAQAISGVLGIKINKSAYITGTSPNMPVCVIPNSSFAVMGLSKSGNRFIYSSINGLKSFAPAFTGIEAACADAGISNVAPGYWRDWGYNSSGSGAWLSWIRG